MSQAFGVRPTLGAVDVYRYFGLVFSVPGEAPISQSNLLKRDFHPLSENAGIPKIRCRVLSHTHTTLLLANEANPKVVSERLGHANIGVTLGTYGPVRPEK